MKKWMPLLCLPACVLFFAHAVFAQANVNEGLETAFLYVDAVKGSDSNNGSQSSPFKTIGKAASVAESNNQGGVGTRVTINPGTYREAISLNHNKKDTSLPITFEAATNGTVLVTGSVLYTGWAQYQSNNAIYTNSWLNKWGTCKQLTSCPFQQAIMMRREMVAVNGTVLTQVLSRRADAGGNFLRRRKPRTALRLAAVWHEYGRGDRGGRDAADASDHPAEIEHRHTRTDFPVRQQLPLGRRGGSHGHIEQHSVRQRYLSVEQRAGYRRFESRDLLYG